MASNSSCSCHINFIVKRPIYMWQPGLRNLKHLRNMQHWSQLYNVTIWCLFCVFIFTEGAAACFWCVSHEVSSVETCLCCFYSHNKTGWADHMPSEVAARKCSHHLQRLRLCRLHHHSPPSSSSGKQGNSLIWFISWALIHWLVLLSVKCGVGGEGIGCIGNVIKGVKEPLKFILLSKWNCSLSCVDHILGWKYIYSPSLRNWMNHNPLAPPTASVWWKKHQDGSRKCLPLCNMLEPQSDPGEEFVVPQNREASRLITVLDIVSIFWMLAKPSLAHVPKLV